MKKLILSLLACSLPFISLDQTFQGVYPHSGRVKDDKGIKRVTVLAWEQIEEKQKKKTNTSSLMPIRLGACHVK